jgi:LmbE family N-acetylglucosaminyl deacetylase
MRVLAVGAHPDDLELLCAGTLARWVREGHEVYMAHLTSGDKGGRQSREELARIRGDEANASAAVIGATALGTEWGDLEVYESRPFRDRVMDFIRQARPDLIVTHAPNDYHPDHRVASTLVFDAAYCSTIPNYPSPAGLEPHAVRAPIWYMDTVAGIGFAPQEYVDVTDTIEIKQRMLSCHQSQLQWMSSYRHSDVRYLVEWVARWRGLQCQVPYAEGFRREDAWGRLRTVRTFPEGMAAEVRAAAGDAPEGGRDAKGGAPR